MDDNEGLQLGCGCAGCAIGLVILMLGLLGVVWVMVRIGREIFQAVGLS